MMSNKGKQDVARTMSLRCVIATGAENARILDEVVATTHRLGTVARNMKAR